MTLWADEVENGTAAAAAATVLLATAVAGALLHGNEGPTAVG
jgi:hypothetical protein